jgi:hypothetical protein
VRTPEQSYVVVTELGFTGGFTFSVPVLIPTAAELGAKVVASILVFGGITNPGLMR